jgi:uncharacterized membrane protein
MTTPPPPPPPQGPSSPQPNGGAPEPSGGFEIGRAFSWSWNQFGSNAQVLLTIGAILVGVQLIVRLADIPISGGFNLSPVQSSGGSTVTALLLGALLPIASFFLTSLVTLGLIRVTLELSRGNRISIGEAFQTDSWGAYILASILNALAVFVGLLFCCVGALVPIVMFAFYGYFIVDQQQQPVDGLKASWDLVRSRLGDTIVLLLCVFGLTFVVGALSCGLGSIFSAPFAALLLAYAYRTLRGETVARAA